MKLNIPIMNRKWDNIDLNFTSRKILADRLKKTVLSLRKLGFTYKQISERCDTSIANISKIINNVD
jgi:transcriptional regulator